MKATLSNLCRAIVLTMLAAPVAHALGVGNIEAHSGLRQPLNARIPMFDTKDVAPELIRVGLASMEDFERARVAYEHSLHALRFSVVTPEDGDPYIHVTSKRAIAEPYLRFLVDVTWPSGRIQKVFTMLMTPPRAERAAPEPPRQADATSPSLTE